MFDSRLWMTTDKVFIDIVCLGVLGLITDRFFRFFVVRFALNTADRVASLAERRRAPSAPP